MNKKLIGICVCILFFGASVVPSISGELIQNISETGGEKTTGIKCNSLPTNLFASFFPQCDLTFDGTPTTSGTPVPGENFSIIFKVIDLEGNYSGPRFGVRLSFDESFETRDMTCDPEWDPDSDYEITFPWPYAKSKTYNMSLLISPAEPWSDPYADNNIHLFENVGPESVELNVIQDYTIEVMNEEQFLSSQYSNYLSSQSSKTISNEIIQKNSVNMKFNKLLFKFNNLINNLLLTDYCDFAFNGIPSTIAKPVPGKEFSLFFRALDEKWNYPGDLEDPRLLTLLVFDEELGLENLTGAPKWDPYYFYIITFTWPEGKTGSYDIRLEISAQEPWVETQYSDNIYIFEDIFPQSVQRLGLQ